MAEALSPERFVETPQSIAGVPIYFMKFDLKEAVPVERLQDVARELASDAEVGRALTELEVGRIEFFPGNETSPPDAYRDLERNINVVRLNLNQNISQIRCVPKRFLLETRLGEVLKIPRLELSHPSELTEQEKLEISQRILQWARSLKAPLRQLQNLKSRRLEWPVNQDTRPEILAQFEKILAGSLALQTKMKLYAERGFVLGRTHFFDDLPESVVAGVGELIEVDIGRSALTLERDFLKFQKSEKERADREAAWEKLRSQAPLVTVTIQAAGPDPLLETFGDRMAEFLKTRFDWKNPDEPLLRAFPAPPEKKVYGRRLAVTDYRTIGSLFSHVQNVWQDTTQAMEKITFRNDSEDCTQLSPELQEKLQNLDPNVPLVLELEVSEPFPFFMEIRSFYDMVQFRTNFDGYSRGILSRFGWESDS
jgi:hypothetical protein